MTRNFAFIDVLQGTTESNKSLALRHVMKGKNVGKTHPQRRRKRQDEEEQANTGSLAARVQPRKRRQVRAPVMSAEPTARSDELPRSCTRSSSDDSKIAISSSPWSCHQDQHHSYDNDNKLLAAWSQDMSPINIGDALVPLALPPQMTVQSLRTFDRFFNCSMHSMYPVPLCLALETHKHWWVRLFLTDETSFHSALALMGTMNDFIMGRDTYSPYHIHNHSSPGSLSSSSASSSSTASHFPSSSAYHLQQAVALVNQRLDNPKLALSDSNLVVINTLILQCLVMKKQQEADVHIFGLQSMVKMRGGLKTVDDEFLAGKICKTELDYALHYGHPTTFHHDQMSRVFTHLENQGFTFPNILGTSSDPHSSTRWAHAITPSLRQILFDTLSIAYLFNSTSSSGGKSDWKLTPGMLQDFTVSVGLRLIKFHPLGLSYDMHSFVDPTSPPGRKYADSYSSTSTTPTSHTNSSDASPLPDSQHIPKAMTPLEAAVHIGLISFLTTLFVQQSGRERRFLQYDLVARRLREVIDSILGPILVRGANGTGDSQGGLGPSVSRAGSEWIGFRVPPLADPSTVCVTIGASSVVGGTGLLGPAVDVRRWDVFGVDGVGSGAVSPGSGAGVMGVTGGGHFIHGDEAAFVGRGAGALSSSSSGGGGLVFPAFLDTLADAAGNHHGHGHLGGGGGDGGRADDVDDGVILWLLLIGSVSVLFEVEHELWLEERMRLMAKRLGVRMWSDVQACVAERFPWIVRMADDLGKERWGKAMKGAVDDSK